MSNLYPRVAGEAPADAPGLLKQIEVLGHHFRSDSRLKFLYGFEPRAHELRVLEHAKSEERGTHA